MIRPCTVYLAVVALTVTTGYRHHVASSAPTTPPRENINAVIIPSSSFSSSPPSQLPSSSIVNSNISTGTAAAMEDVGDDNNLSNSSSPNPSLLRGGGGGSGSSSSSERKSISEYPLSPQKEQQQQQSKSSSRSSEVAFLYELYEHEIYNPQTNSWTSRRFTQSPNTGGGGRDSTSLDPGTCVPPRNYIFDGEWKIEMSSSVVVVSSSTSSSSSSSSEERDGFGWECYVGRYDGLGRRRRRWVRSLLRVQQHGGKDDVGVTTRTRQNNAAAAAATRLSSSSSKKKQTKIKQKQQQQVKNNNLLRTIQEQYNFKGFGWSINKSVIFLHSIGATLRIPLSANFDSYEQYRAAPFISTGIYFGYPWAIATMLNASLPIEAIQWSIAGILYKIQWGMAVTSASIRLCIDVVLYVFLWPWRLWSTVLKAMTKVIESSRVLTTRQQQKQHVDPSKAAELIVNDTDGRTIVSIETHIELNNNNNNSSLNNEVEEDDNSETVVSVVDSPRGGGGGGGGESGRRRDTFDVVTSEKMVPFFRKEHRTILGHEVPPYHRSTTIEYSSTIQERLGVSMSWRLSRNRGYEYRCNFFFSCMPTRTFWKQLEEERKRRLESFVAQRKNEKVSAMTPLDLTPTDDKIGTINIDSSRYLQNIRSVLPSFLTEHYSAVGLSTGWPLPMEPYYALSLVLSMSGFYYGWLMDAVRSVVVPSRRGGSYDEEDKKLGSPTENISTSGKIVSSMLKKKNLSLDDEDDDNVIEIAENDDDSTSIGSKKAKAK